MSKFKNNKKQRRVQSLAVPPVAEYGNIPARLKFNFSLLDTSQEGAYTFRDLSESQRLNLINTLEHLSKRTRKEWETEGSISSRRLKVYHDFPEKSRFTHPRNVPDSVSWARFRIEGKFRLAGFFIPDSLHGTVYDENADIRFDKNTFYAVFIDPEHNFYLSPDR